MRRTIIMFCSIIIAALLNVQFVNASSQNLSKTVKSSYNSNNKELYIWGSNINGNLGNGSYSNVTESNKVKVNDLIGKQKILDYAITNSQTYVLTSNNKVYATGYSVGDGRKLSFRNTFIEIKLYDQNKHKVNNIDIKSKTDGNCKENSEYSRFNCTVVLKMTTSNKNITYSYYNGYVLPLTVGYSGWFIELDRYTYGKTNNSLIRPIYNKKSGDYVTRAVVDNDGKLTFKYVVNKKARKFYKYLYNNGQISYYRSYSDYKDIIKYYKNGSKIKERKIYYKLRSNKSRSMIKEYQYYYKKNKLVYRYTYEKNNKSMILKQKKYYYSNKKNQLKSNKNGKARTYVTYYKNKKAYLTYRYNYNKNGKMINKTKVRLKLKY